MPPECDFFVQHSKESNFATFQTLSLFIKLKNFHFKYFSVETRLSKSVTHLVFVHSYWLIIYSLRVLDQLSMFRNSQKVWKLCVTLLVHHLTFGLKLIDHEYIYIFKISVLQPVQRYPGNFLMTLLHFPCTPLVQTLPTLCNYRNTKKLDRWLEDLWIYKNGQVTS